MVRELGCNDTICVGMNDCRFTLGPVKQMSRFVLFYAAIQNMTARVVLVFDGFLRMLLVAKHRKTLLRTGSTAVTCLRQTTG